MKVLVACEESQTVTIEFRKLGHEAYSCDLEPCSGGHPEWHIQDDVTPYLTSGLWDMILAFPPCTHLSSSGAWLWKQKQGDGRQQQGIDFFMRCINANCDRVVVENPVGIMSTIYRKPDQIIQPFQFGESFWKKTCLWIKGLPLLVGTNLVPVPPRKRYPSGSTYSDWHSKSFSLPPKERARFRSKTFLGIAQAMADQWGRMRE